MVLKKPTLDEFKAMAKASLPAARALIEARAFAAAERERVDAYINPIFTAYKFTYGDLGQKCGRTGLLADKDELYLAEDGPLVAAYYADCDAAHRAHGFTGPKGHCPALTAEHLVIEAERHFIDLTKPLLGIDSEGLYGDAREKYLDLFLKACLQAERDGKAGLL